MRREIGREKEIGRERERVREREGNPAAHISAAASAKVPDSPPQSSPPSLSLKMVGGLYGVNTVTPLYDESLIRDAETRKSDDKSPILGGESIVLDKKTVTIGEEILILDDEPVILDATSGIFLLPDYLRGGRDTPGLGDILGECCVR
jgi:hypothetical protein